MSFLNLGIEFEELYSLDGLTKLNLEFENYFAQKQPKIFADFVLAKNKGGAEANSLIEFAKVLEDFIAEAFLIEQENQQLRARHNKLAKIYRVKRDFVRRTIAKSALAVTENGEEILNLLGINSNQDVDQLEIKLADEIDVLMKHVLSAGEEKRFELLTRYCLYALKTKAGKKFHESGTLFKLAQSIDFEKLFEFEVSQSDGLNANFSKDLKPRDGFNLTDPGASLNTALGEANYCIYCHNQKKDTCRKGIVTTEGKTEFKVDPCGFTLHGCPLDQKISEMNLLKAQGFLIAALAVITIDNPTVAGTGHRICNDCMKSCIFQKQDPVDVPQIETRILKDVLQLPYGFEIYSLFTRWNPLKFTQPLPKNSSGKKVLVCGMGPAGYTLAHYLLNLGHSVVGIDGLKIEPLSTPFVPIKDLAQIYQPLEKRVIAGFGGVSEYGITTRWDKNYLSLIRLLLERRAHFQLFGGLRFGSSITYDEAFNKYGFDHIALCMGAGKPTWLKARGNEAKGIRSASEFLMALQLNAAFKKDSLFNLHIRLPAIVVGGGLTAVDTATEALAYYPVQVEKFSERYAKLDGTKIRAQFTAEENQIADEFLAHAAALKNLDPAERLQFLKNLGGVKILYRKRIQDSPAYRLNHHELSEAFKQGIELIEQTEIAEIESDQFGHVCALKTKDGNLLACRSLLFALGTSPNISVVTEGELKLDLAGKHFKRVAGQFIVKVDRDSQKAVSYFGDLHPEFEGSVVKAMASAKLGAGEIDAALASLNSAHSKPSEQTREHFQAKVAQIKLLSDYAVELVIKSKLLAAKTKVGHIFRLQNYAANSSPNFEPIPLTALSVDCEQGLITTVITEAGASSKSLRQLREGDPVIFMGPSGKPTEIVSNQNVLMIGGGRGNLPLYYLAAAHQAQGCKVTLLLGYRKNDYVSMPINSYENVCDSLIFAIQNEAPSLNLNRSSDRQYQGNVIEALGRCAAENDFKSIDRIFAIGSDAMMSAIDQALNHQLKSYFKPEVTAIASLNSSMQCMLKGVCSQCVTRLKKPDGTYEYFYACAAQDQAMDEVDFQYLNSRTRQNSLEEKVSLGNFDS